MTYSTTIKTTKGEFNNKNNCILADNFISPFSYNPHNCQLWVIGNEYGAILALWANNEQDAFDAMLDAGFEHFLIDPADYAKFDEDEKMDCAYLGNAGEPCDLTYAWITPAIIDLNTKQGFDLIKAFIIAEERQLDNLDFNY